MELVVMEIVAVMMAQRPIMWASPMPQVRAKALKAAGTLQRKHVGPGPWKGWESMQRLPPQRHCSRRLS